MMAEVVTEEQLRALCEEFGYPAPGPNTIRIAQENALSEAELRQRFVAMQLIQSEEPSLAEMDAAYERAMARTPSFADKLTLTQHLVHRTRIIQMMYDLCQEVVGKSNWSEAGYYVVDRDARDELADFLADFHDDNEPLWNLLTEEQKRRE